MASRVADVTGVVIVGVDDLFFDVLSRPWARRSGARRDAFLSHIRQCKEYPPSVTALKTGTNMFLDPIRLGVIGVFFKDRVYDGTRTIFST
eukprot:scaffold73661_cov25-Cyclotella_meneghiniana.AAC.1